MAAVVSPGPILLVEDDADSRFMMAKLLGAVGYEVVTAANGDEALELVEERDFALVILDYMMPRMHGLELFNRLRELRPGIKGIFLTGYLTPSSTGAALDAGAKRVLAKPVPVEELVGVIEEIAVRC